MNWPIENPCSKVELQWFHVLGFPNAHDWQVGKYLVTISGETAEWLGVRWTHLAVVDDFGNLVRVRS